MTPRFDADEMLRDTIKVDKLEAASRQLDSAITMFFNDWDVVSQHTLIGAGHGIVYDLAKRRAIGGSIKDSPLVAPEDKAQFLEGIHGPQNFFKHADRDPERRINFPHGMSQFLLFDAVRLCVLLRGSPTERMQIFLMWFQLRYPDLFCLPPAEQELSTLRGNLNNDPRGFKVIARRLIQELDVKSAA